MTSRILGSAWSAPLLETIVHIPGSLEHTELPQQPQRMVKMIRPDPAAQRVLAQRTFTRVIHIKRTQPMALPPTQPAEVLLQTIPDPLLMVDATRTIRCPDRQVTGFCRSTSEEWIDLENQAQKNASLHLARGAPAK
ncbi:MAG: hypothetical protein ACYCUE_10635 [Steroidobacteraceae bacterium]|jgi:hypothetical protein